MRRPKARAARVAIVIALVGVLTLTASAAFAQTEVPVYRFYNQGTGTHFYTASAEEMQNVQTKWSNVFTYEGVGFYTGSPDVMGPDAIGGLVPLYRFYNTKNKSHFYTISAQERDAVKAKYPTTFTYEGEAFFVYSHEVADQGPYKPVYRFYNKLNGSHFYTISEFEKSLAQVAWGSTYSYEGIAFYAFPWMFN